MSLNSSDRLLIAAKMVVNDMDELARLQQDVPVFFGMGQALNRMYCVLRKIPARMIPTLKPIEMMAWIRAQPVPGLDSNKDTNRDIMKKLESVN